MQSALWPFDRKGVLTLLNHYKIYEGTSLPKEWLTKYNHDDENFPEYDESDQ